MYIETKRYIGLEYLLPLMPLLSEYNFGGVQLVVVAMAFVAVQQLCRQDFRLIFNQSNIPFIILFSYLCFKDIFVVFLGPSNMQESLNKWIMQCVYFGLFFVLSASSFNINKYYKVLKIVCLFYTVGLIIHLFQIHVLDQSVVGISLVPGYDFANTHEPFRPRSFFSEPSSYAVAMAPLLFLSIMKCDYKTAYFATIALLLSSSALGIMIAFVFWSYMFVSSNTKFWKKVVFLACGAFIVYFVASFSFAQSSILKISDSMDGGGSFDYRITLGFLIIRYLNVNQWIFGTLYNVPYDFIKEMNIGGTFLFYLDSSYTYLNTFCCVIFKYGIIGAVLYYYPLFRWLKMRKFYGKAFVIALIVETMGGSLFFNSHYFGCMLLFLMLEQNKTEVIKLNEIIRFQGEKHV